MRPGILLALLLLTGEPLHGQIPETTSSAPRNPLRVLTSSPAELEVELSPFPDNQQSAESFLFAVPPGLLATAAVIDAQFTSAKTPSSAPVPAGGEPLVEILGPFTYRYQHICAVRVLLNDRNADGGISRRLTRARIRISFEGNRRDAATHTPDPLFEGVLRSALVNYEQGRHWRTPPEITSSQARHAEGRVSLNGPAVLVGVAEDGWTTITQAQLAQTGLNSATIDPSTYRLFNGNEELPLVIGPDTSISFLGFGHTRTADDPEPLTDTTTCRLLWGGEAGRRYSIIPDWGQGSADTLEVAPAEAAFERNTGYFAGATELEVIDNDPVPGEGWYWARVFPGESVSLPVDLPHVATSAPGTATVAIRLVSMTPDSPGVDHRARVVLNDSLISVQEFEGRTAVTIQAPVPTAHLRAGGNTVVVTAEPTPRPASLFAVDRISVTYTQELRATHDLLLFTANTPPGPEGVIFSAGGFSDSAISVRDPETGRTILPARIIPDTAGLFTVLWRDTLTVPRRYCVVSVQGARPPASLRKRDMADLRTLTGGADCIILTHAAFRPAAERLAAHRRMRTGLRVIVVDVEDVYHTFNAGIPDPSAIREFLRAAYTSWQPPAPGAVVLLGDASWDPRRFLGTTTRANFVPAYGFPAGDSWYGILDTADVPVIQIGRIPAADPVEAAVAVEKLIRYDGVPSGAWVKRFLFVTGGTTPAEQTTYRTRSETLIREHVVPDPIAGEVLRTYKTSDAVFDTGLRDSLRRDFARGLLFLHYLGHSTSRSWGVDAGPAAALGTDGSRFPFVASVSCNIGAFAEPSGSVLAEDLLLAEGGGAIAVWASSSLGYPIAGTQLVNAMLSAMRGDSLRGLGELTSAALLRLWQADPTDPIVRAMVRLNPLLGDPLTRLALPTLPDPAIAPGDIMILPPVEGATGGRTVTLRARVLNLGVSRGDTIAVKVDVAGGPADPPMLTTTIPVPVRRADTVSFAWRTDAASSSWHARVTLDPDNRIPEADELNNVAAQSLQIHAPALLPLRPLTDQRVAPGTVELAVTVPPGLDSAGTAVMFEVDTSADFTSPALVRSGPVVAGPLKADWLVPPLVREGTYFWRARAAQGGDAGLWSGSRFRIGPGAPSPPEVRLGQSDASQFAHTTLDGLVATDSGVTIAPPLPAAIYVRSLGNRADASTGAYSSIRYGDLEVTGQWWIVGRSFMVLRVPAGGTGAEFRAFDCATDAAQADSMVRFLDRATAGDHLAIAAVLDGSTNVSDQLKQRLEMLGSARIRQVRPGDAWVLITRKGDPGSVREELTADTAQASAEFIPARDSVSGVMVAGAFAPPVRWDSLAWEASGTGPAERVTMLLRVIRTFGSPETLAVYRGWSGALALDHLNLAQIAEDAIGIEPVVVLSSHQGEVVPVLRSWSIRFTGAPELLVRTVVQAGGRQGVIGLDAMVHNLGFTVAESVRVVVVAPGSGPSVRPVAAAALGPVAAGGTASAMLDLASADVPAGRVGVEVDPVLPRFDLLRQNNAIDVEIPDVAAVRFPFRVLADGAAIMDGDAVAAAPLITVELPEWFAGQMLRHVAFRVDDVPVEAVQGEAGFRPALSAGAHRLELTIVKENTASALDTITRGLDVRVEEEVHVRDLYNFPNPFAGSTVVTFTITGSEPPEAAVVRVFTVRGRKIHEISLRREELRVGINTLEWDGRDADGDAVANGTYLYQITVTRADGTTETLRQKLVRVR